ncbi:hypothetical protein C0Q70_09427 [Pomacea canaliculata]|uniref:Uncharacterized protein n=1 Tax=Pomacea canaliculata TaxID=400727 RepID=A0A2T7P9R8_POMCA|nr:hypothetical protein C0Q70_09427 [Pomacea canaliculata]
MWNTQQVVGGRGVTEGVEEVGVEVESGDVVGDVTLVEGVAVDDEGVTEDVGVEEGVDVAGDVVGAVGPEGVVPVAGGVVDEESVTGEVVDVSVEVGDVVSVGEVTLVEGVSAEDEDEGVTDDVLMGDVAVVGTDGVIVDVCEVEVGEVVGEVEIFVKKSLWMILYLWKAGVVGDVVDKETDVEYSAGVEVDDDGVVDVDGVPDEVAEEGVTEDVTLVEGVAVDDEGVTEDVGVEEGVDVAGDVVGAVGPEGVVPVAGGVVDEESVTGEVVDVSVEVGDVVSVGEVTLVEGVSAEDEGVRVGVAVEEGVDVAVDIEDVVEIEEVDEGVVGVEEVVAVNVDDDGVTDDNRRRRSY